MHPTYQLVEGDQITGPHSLAVLRQKAEIRVINSDTPARPVVQPPEPWRPIRDWPELHDQLFVAKTAPKLGATRFHATNVKTDAESAPVDVISLLKDNAAHERAATEKRKARPGRPLVTCLIVIGCVAALLAIAYALASYLKLFPSLISR